MEQSLSQSSLGALASIVILAVIAAAAFAAWLLRRQELSLAWLSLAALAWLAFFLPALGGLPLIYPALLATVGLAAVFSGTPVPIRWAVIAGAASVALAAILSLVGAPALTWGGAVAACGLALAAIAYLVFRSIRSRAKIETFVALAALFGACAATAHDVLPMSSVRLLPFAIAAALAVTGLAILYRVMTVVSSQELESELLRKRIETTKANLLMSESARRALEIANAVTQERERMMREIHDGIGSGLVAALASAERQGKESTTAVVALKGALIDLRIAVDSLEQVEGDVAALLASLRYRYEPELRKAGISVEWLIDEVPALNWLDSSSALHVLRILQECVGNVLGHSQASTVTFRCNLSPANGRPGLRIEVSDNGRGFDPTAPHMGRGRRNMSERAAAIGGKLDIRSAPGEGTRTVLWLPLVRQLG